MGMDYFQLVKYTENELARARGANFIAPLKLTTALWLDLYDKHKFSTTPLLEIHPVLNDEDWQKMIELRLKVESRFGLLRPEDAASMVNEIKLCQQKLNAQWYLAYLPGSAKAIGEVGLAKFELNGIKYGRLQDIDIEPAYQGQGLGNSLLHTIICLGLEEGLQALCLKADNNDWPLEWYQRNGFLPVGEWMS